MKMHIGLFLVAGLLVAAEKPASRPNWLGRLAAQAAEAANQLGHSFDFAALQKAADEVAEIAGQSGDQLGYITAAKGLGAQIDLDLTSPQSPVAMVNLVGTKITDADLARLARYTAWKGLRTLYLSGTRITAAGLAHLKGIPEIESLGLADTRVTDAGLAHLAGLATLPSLGLGGTRISDTGLAQLSRMTRLQELSLADTAITDAGLAHLERLASLRTLNLSRTRITDKGLAHLERLARVGPLRDASRIGLFTSPFGQGPFVAAYALFPEKTVVRLQRVYLQGTGVTEAGVRRLQKALPGAVIIR